MRQCSLSCQFIYPEGVNPLSIVSTVMKTIIATGAFLTGSTHQSRARGGKGIFHIEGMCDVPLAPVVELIKQLPGITSAHETELIQERGDRHAAE